MLKSDIKPGTEYAMREKRLSGAPVQHVRVLEHLRGNKWKAEWIEPNPGLVHYVESGHLIAPWKGLKRFLKEESDAERMREHNERQGHRGRSPVDVALIEVFETVGEEVRFDHGSLSGLPEAIGRVKIRAGMDPSKTSLVAYLDRQGILHLPFDEALEVGRRFCAAEPATVSAKIEATERKWAQDSTRAGEEYLVDVLNEFRAAWALIRQWAGHDAAVAQREVHIERLERLVWDAVYALQKAGLDSEAARLRRALERR